MNVTERYLLELPVETGQQLPDACCSNLLYAACAHGPSITVCYLPKLEVQPMVLHSSFLPCAALCIQEFTGQLGGRARHLLPHQQQQTLLAAATPSGVLIWVIQDAYAAAADHLEAPPPLRLMDSEQQGFCEAVAFSSSGAGCSQLLLAVGCGNRVLVWGLPQLEVLFRLEGHQGAITALAFSPQHQHQLVTAAEDRTFKVWDLEAGQLVYQSSILGAAMPTCLALDVTAARLAMGCSDGTVRQFNLSHLPECRELMAIDVSRFMQQTVAAAVTAASAAELTHTSGPKTITATTCAGGAAGGVLALQQHLQQLCSLSAAGSNGAGKCSTGRKDVSTDCSASGSFQELLGLQAEGSGCVLGMQFVQFTALQLHHDSSWGGSSSCLHSQQLLRELLQPPPQLLVCTRQGLLLLNMGKCEVERCYVFGMKASRAWDVLREAGSRPLDRTPSVQQAQAPLNQLQQQPAQQLQQQARHVSCFRALPCIDQPAAACCFATLSGKQKDMDPSDVLFCVASASSASFAVVQLNSRCEDVHFGSGSSRIVSSTCSSLVARMPQLSVFQTQPLPAGSPLLEKTAWRSSGSSSSSGSSGTGTPTKRPSSSSSSPAAAAAVPRSQAPTSAEQTKTQRATWLADGSAAAGASAGKRGAPAGSSPSKAAAAAPKPKPKKTLPADKAVTFHTQIKSSGYGFVQPKIKLGQAKPAPIKVGGPASNKVPQLLAHQLSAQRQYPLDAAPPGEWGLQPDQGLPEGQAVHNGGILRLAFAGDGCRLLTSSADRTARCLWLPVGKHAGAGTTFVGHGGPVLSVSWSHTGEHLLTSSADRTAKLWSCTDAASLITFDSLQQHKSNTDSSSSSSGRRPNGIHRTRSDSGSNKGISPSKLTRSSSSSSSGGSSKQACAASRAIGRPGGTAPSHIDSASEMEFLTEITAAQFFYMDQFVLLTTGNKLHLCRYKLADAPASDDLQRLRATGSYSLAGSYSSTCQTIADVAAANSFLSTLILLACSNRSIELVDAATLQVACTISDAHSRPVQRLVQPAASPFTSHPRDMHELFASAAPDGLVRLWDVRSGACVRSFTGHKHASSQMPVGLAFSPCMRYLATGSEDKAAYVYDLRTCAMLARLRPPGAKAEVVTDVAFHPVKPQLVVGCMDGRLHWYGDAF